MKKHFKSLFFFSFCLAVLLLGVGTASKSSAATLTPSKLLSGGYDCLVPGNIGISYDANAYTTRGFPSQWFYLPIFSKTGSNAPSIGAVQCANGNVGYDISLELGNPGAGWYNVRTTVDGITTQTSPVGQLVYEGDLKVMDLTEPADQQYTIQAQSCSHVLWQVTCSDWSPTVHLATAADPSCQNGYVYRDAAPFDHVCVTPDQQQQVADDNSQVPARVDPWWGTYGPQSCSSGYVWREAFGGDFVCVTSAERDQVASDNSQALARIIQF